MLTSFPDGYRAAVIGASGGIGAALTAALHNDARCGAVYALSRTPDTRAASTEDTGRLIALRADYDALSSLTAAAAEIEAGGPLHIAIIATGLLHDGDRVAPEKDWRHITAEQMARVLHVNTIGPSLVAQAFLPLMPKDGRSVLAALGARVGSIGDNGIGGWYSYRASKAALAMIIKSLAIELARKKRATIAVALHPGTVDTGLSEPFQANTRAGQVVPPAKAAADLLHVIDGLDVGSSGGHFAYDGQRIGP
ncbi:MAG: SDR family oxidoreductase [Pseudomonadota bacterium]